MLRETLLIWWHLGILTKKRADALTARFGDLDSALAHFSEELLRELKVKEEAVRDTLERIGNMDVEALEAKLERNGITVVSFDDEAYPAILREIPDAPMFLSYRGDLSVLKNPMIGLVGTRAMSKYGMRVTDLFVEPIVKARIVTVSGLALGIDTRVAEQTLKYGGKTVAVLGHGLSMISPPSNLQLADEIVEKGGLILSEFPLDLQPGHYTFPARNRIIAGLSLGTVVLEAPVKSGAIITADLALDYNRAVFAVPGQIFDENYAGCHELIARGHARLVTSAEEVLQEMGFVTSASPQLSLFEPQSPEEEALYALLSGLPKSVDELVQESRLAPSAVSVALTMMELAGAAKKVGGNGWVRN